MRNGISSPRRCAKGIAVSRLALPCVNYWQSTAARGSDPAADARYSQFRQQDQERRHRMSPETGEQARFVRQWRDTDGSR